VGGEGTRNEGDELWSVADKDMYNNEPVTLKARVKELFTPIPTADTQNVLKSFKRAKLHGDVLDV